MNNEKQEYIEKESLLHVISELPVTEFNGVELYPAERIKKVIQFLPTRNEFPKSRTDFLYYGVGHAKHNEDYIFCKECNKGVVTYSYLMDNIEFCPYCGAIVNTIRSAEVDE